jgi:hypothetical protein
LIGSETGSLIEFRAELSSELKDLGSTRPSVHYRTTIRLSIEIIGEMRLRKIEETV